MQDKMVTLTEAEWSIMEFLWEHDPASGRQITEFIEEERGWTRSTTLTLLSRLEAKGAVRSSRETGKKLFSPVLKQDEARLQETRNFLKRVYRGSLSMMISSLTEKQTLTQEEIDELYDLLKNSRSDHKEE